jgi:hypothetical protein
MSALVPAADLAERQLVAVLLLFGSHEALEVVRVIAAHRSHLH